MASVNFADVKKIVIPQGEVTKITKTDDGTVLWEQRAKASQTINGGWSRDTSVTIKTIYYHSLDSSVSNFSNAKYYRIRLDGTPVVDSTTTFTDAREFSIMYSLTSGGGVYTACKILVTPLGDGKLQLSQSDTLGWRTQTDNKNRVLRTGSDYNAMTYVWTSILNSGKFKLILELSDVMY